MRATRLASKTRLFLVDDHPVIRRGLQLIISLESNLAVCGEASTVALAYQRILEEKPDLAIIDLSLGDGSGLDLIRRLHEQLPQLRILVLSMHHEPFYAQRALQAGASGYVTKAEGVERVMEGIQALAIGRLYLNRELADRVLKLASNPGPRSARMSGEHLGKRELEVLELIGQGLSTREIAAKLQISVKTVESHREHIKDKLSLSSGAELARYAFNWRNEPAGGKAWRA
jgi:DNA-binding NarL/FixJ family response regulator